MRVLGARDAGLWRVALFVAPVLVLASYFVAPQPLDLAFSRAEIIALMFFLIPVGK